MAKDEFLTEYLNETRLTNANIRETNTKLSKTQEDIATSLKILIEQNNNHHQLTTTKINELSNDQKQLANLNQKVLFVLITILVAALGLKIKNIPI